VSVSAERFDYMQTLTEKYAHQKVLAVEGASSRHRSIYNGVKAIDLGESVSVIDLILLQAAEMS
jgi:2-C-methyl-D-erythritol 4-phosphate cytidylyltransferase